MQSSQLVKNKIGFEVFSRVLALGNFTEDIIDLVDIHRIPIFNDISRKCELGEKLIFILPAFPAKSANPNKTSGALADLGEVVALQRLNEFCAEVSNLYEPGAEVIICSDGHVFNDLVFVSEEDLVSYKNMIFHIIEEFNLRFLKTYDLEDFYQENSKDRKMMKSLFIQDFCSDLDELKALIKESEDTLRLFNGIHRFIKDDLSYVDVNLSRNQLEKKSKKIAYKVIQRSRAWDKLLSLRFKDALRLSIHPYPITHRKFGVKLVASSHKWATPWHNILVEGEDGHQLMRLDDAISLSYKKKLYRGRYAYFSKS